MLVMFVNQSPTMNWQHSLEREKCAGRGERRKACCIVYESGWEAASALPTLKTREWMDVWMNIRMNHQGLNEDSWAWSLSVSPSQNLTRETRPFETCPTVERKDGSLTQHLSPDDRNGCWFPEGRLEFHRFLIPLKNGQTLQSSSSWAKEDCAPEEPLTA